MDWNPESSDLRKGGENRSLRLIEARRDFHRYPEVRWTEYRTSAIVAEKLENLGYHVSMGIEVINPDEIIAPLSEEEKQKEMQRSITQGANPHYVNRMKGYPGVIGILETGKPGPTIAFRFDIDALHHQEALADGHYPFDQGFSSVNKGVVHACGHDGHTAIGLGLAETLMDGIDALRGTFKLLFQPSEEGGGGARAMIAKGGLEGVDYLFVGHIGLAHQGVPLPSGAIAGGCHDFLDNRRYDVTFTGKAAHPCADPHNGRNALLAACTAALAIHGIAPHSEGLSRVNVGKMNAGVSRNTIAPIAVLEIEARGESDATADYVEKRVMEVIKGAALAQNVNYHIENRGRTLSASSDQELIDMVLSTARKIDWFDQFYEAGNVGGSDDAADMIRYVQSQGGKGTYIGLGADFAASYHDSHFDFDESVLEPSVELFAKLVKEVCRTHNKTLK